MATALPATSEATTKALLMLDPMFTAAFPSGRKPRPKLLFRYNPKDVKISGGTTWGESGSSEDSEDVPVEVFRSQNKRTLSFQLFVDQFELPSGDVEREINALHDWTVPRMNAAKNKSSAPWLRFQWGAKSFFRCYLDSYNITYSMFSRSGAPLRAEVDVKLNELRDPIKGTNPTSGGEGGERVHTVALGDSLHSVAYQYYSQPRAWRALAAFNGIDDPQRLPTGTVLELPDPVVLEELL